MKAIYSKEEASKRDKESKRRYYVRNKEKVDADARKRRDESRKRNKDFVKEYKHSNICRCGESCIHCLDFHHKDPSIKDRCINHAAKAPVSSQRLQEEVKKCIVICTNCHRKLHYPSRDRQWNNVNKRKNNARLFVWEYKKNFSCKCGEDHPSCLDFHHKYGDKEKNISKLAKDGYALKTIQAEIDKCEIVCSNCHRKIHCKEL